MCILFSLQLLSNTCLRLRRIQRDIIKNVRGSSCQISVIPVSFCSNLNFFNRFWKKAQVSNLMKIRSVVTEFFQSDGQTDRHDEATSRFWQFSNASKNEVINTTRPSHSTSFRYHKNRFVCWTLYSTGSFNEHIFEYLDPAVPNKEFFCVAFVGQP